MPSHNQAPAVRTGAANPSCRIKVLVIQPVIAHYRVPLFEGLRQDGNFEVRVFASDALAGFPGSVTSPPPWADTSHSAFRIGGQLYWQRGMRIPRDFSAGDVLVIDGNPRFLSNVPLLLEARRRGVGIVAWGHGWSPTSKQWRARIRYRYMEQADVVLVYTDAEVRALKALRAWKVPIVAANNALDESRFHDAAHLWGTDRLARFADSLELGDRRLLLFCGRLRAHPSTELDVALRALALLRARGTECVLGIVGSGETEASLRQLAQELGVADLLRWGGSLYREEDLAPWFLSATCFVYPGAIGLSLLHALGYGLPTITHDIRRLHPPEIAALKEGGNGFLFKKGDAADLADKVTQLCSDGMLRNRMAACARETVQHEFSMRAMINRFAAAIRLASRHPWTRYAQDG